jgi:hypothetical protein
VAAAASLAACTTSSEGPAPPIASEPQRGGRIELGVVGEPETLDPYAPNASDLTFALVRPVFPMPYRLLLDGTTEPDLAASIDVRGGRALLRLRATTWSDGSPVTARDVVASIERAAPPSGFAAVTDARVLSPRVVELRGTVEDWPATLASGAYVLPGGKLAAGRISGGPFRFHRYVQGRRLTYERNDEWDGEASLLDTIEVGFVQGTQLLVRLLEDERLDVAALPMSVNLDERLDELGVAHAEALGSEMIAIEARPGGLSDPEWQSLAAAIDVGRLVESFVRDDGERAATNGGGERSPLPVEISLAAPEGDELLGLMQRAIQLDLERSGVTSQLITGPLSTHYGTWRDAGPADLSLVRVAGAPGAVKRDRRTLEIARIETIVAWREGVNGIVVNPTLDGPLWNASQWWIEAPI